MVRPPDDQVLEHITLTTGNRRISARTEVDPTVLQQVRVALTLGGGRLPGGAWSIVWPAGYPAGLKVYDLRHRGRNVVSCWLCVDSAAAVEAWRLIARVADMIGCSCPKRPSMVPWLVAALAPSPGLADDPAWPDIVMQAGDLERVVAWASL